MALVESGTPTWYEAGPIATVKPDQPQPETETRVPVRAFATVWVTLFLDLVAFGIILPVLPFYAEHFGASPQVVTLLSTTFSLAQFAAAPVLGRISDRFGRRTVMLVSIAGGIASMLTLGLATSLAMVFVARVVNGLANANIPTAYAYVADRVAPAQRAKYMGMMGAAIGLGFVFGPALGGLLSSKAMPHTPFFVAAGLSSINWVMAWRWLPESRPVDPRRRARRSMWSAAGTSLRGTALGLLVVINFSFYVAFSAMESTFALAGEAKLGWGALETGILFAFIGIVIFITQGVLVGPVVARLGERGALACGLVVLSGGLVATGLTESVAWLAVGGAGIAVGNGLVSPSVSALVSQVSAADEQGLGLGLNASAAALARIFGPLGAGFAFEQIAPGAPFLLGACLLWAVCMPLTWWLGRRIVAA